jgi:hypothetical protein
MGFFKSIDDQKKDVWIRIIASTNYDKYRVGNFGLNMDVDYYGGGLKEAPDRLQERFDLAQKIIEKAESDGLDTNNVEVLQNLGKEVRSKMDGIHHKIWSIFKNS